MEREVGDMDKDQKDFDEAWNRIWDAGQYLAGIVNEVSQDLGCYVVVEFRNNQMIGSAVCKLYVDSVFLDKDPRNRDPHELQAPLESGIHTY